MAIQGQPSGTKKRPKKVSKATAGKGKVVLIVPKGKEARQPKRILIFGCLAVALIFLFLLIYFTRKEPPRHAQRVAPMSPSSPASTPVPASAPAPAAADASSVGTNTVDLPAIRAVTLHPFQPTRRDTLRAEVLAESYETSGIAYVFEWRVNDRVVAGATADKIDLANFNTGDLVMVAVTPYAGNKAGYPVRSPFVVIHGGTPTLDIIAERRPRKAGEPLEIQMVSVHPDGGQVAFRLEEPLLPGMSIDRHSGKITWKAPPDQKGKISFAASVEDTDGTKLVKTFEIILE